MNKPPTITELSLMLTGAFESELLVELMLRHWNHPRAHDSAFRASLLESASDVLRASADGEKLFEELQPQRVNLVAAIVYAESASLASDPDVPTDERALREKWLETVRRSVPSCFCDPDDLA